jgi:hypothetical protein
LHPLELTLPIRGVGRLYARCTQVGRHIARLHDGPPDRFGCRLLGPTHRLP